MQIINYLKKIWSTNDHPFLIHSEGELKFKDITNKKSVDLYQIKKGEVVALIGDFNPQSILTFLKLIEKNVIILPLTIHTRSQHKYFFDAAFVNVVIEGSKIYRIKNKRKHKLIDYLKKKNHAGLILFSTGTTGRPKAILHDLALFLRRFKTPRPTLKTISFLLFDHIGGLNTLLHTLFNKGTVICPKSRNVKDVLNTCKKYKVELLPTTPTFLRMLLISGLIPKEIPNTLKIITYGTERMDQPTLDELCKLLPNIDFRQTFGMSELGIVRVKTKARNSLFMKIGGEGIEVKVINKVLKIKSSNRMLGYLNAKTPFEKNGWYNTQDIVEEMDGFFKITGRKTEVINVGGLKFMASEVEKVALQYNGVKFAKAVSKKNPITGEHVELIVQKVLDVFFDKKKFKYFLSKNLESYMCPKRIEFSDISIGHRFKKN
ncbi:fatty acid--CoA ligase family protein [Candidatus Pelagibacter sp.]|nr:fatty acid--CoA ligase family protein [Candidatus Pelagibacter sp.]